MVLILGLVLLRCGFLVLRGVLRLLLTVGILFADAVVGCCY